MNMIEKVARAICKCNNWDSVSWDVYINDARAAIAAMREPTESQLRAALGGSSFLPCCE